MYKINGNKFNQVPGDVHTGNYKSLLKEIREDK